MKASGERFFVLKLRSTTLEINPLRKEFMSDKQDEL